MDGHDLETNLHRGLRWALIRQIITGLTGTLGAVAYSRLLHPEDLGAATLAFLVYNGLVLLVEAPIRDAVIYYQAREAEHGSAAFWLLLGFGGGGGILVAAGAGALARFYGAPAAAGLTRAVAAAFFFQAIAVVPGALLLKHFRFALHEGLQTILSLLLLAGWLLLAAGGWGPWSLVLPSLAGAVFWAAATWLATGFRPLLRPGRDAFRAIVRFSRSLLGSQAITYLQANLDQAAVGTLGEGPLGWYSFGESQSAFAVVALGGPVAQIALPAMAAVQARLAALRQIYLEMLRLTATLSTPMQIGTLVLADLGVRLIFGQQWLGAVPVLRAYLTFRLVQALLPLGDAALSALGRPEVRFAVRLAQLPFFAAGVWFGLRVWGGIEGVAWSLAIVRAVAGMLYFAVVMRLADLDARTTLRRLLPSSLAGALMGLLVYALHHAGLVRGLLAAVGEPRLLAAADLLVLTLIGAASYFAILFVLDPPGFRSVLTLARQIVRNPKNPRR
jgi:PST family polysaccharide transporter